MWPSRQEMESQCYKMRLFSFCSKLILKSVLLCHIAKQVTQYLSFPLNNLKRSMLSMYFREVSIFPPNDCFSNKHINVQLNNSQFTFETNNSYLLTLFTAVVTAKIYCILFHLLYRFHYSKVRQKACTCIYVCIYYHIHKYMDKNTSSHTTFKYL